VVFIVCLLNGRRRVSPVREEEIHHVTGTDDGVDDDDVNGKSGACQALYVGCAAEHWNKQFM